MVFNKLVINRTEEGGLDLYGSGNVPVLGSCEHSYCYVCV